MAPPPSRRLITMGDVPDAPGWLERLLGPLNSFMSPVVDALSHGLTFRENFSGEVREVEVMAPDDWVPLADYIVSGSGWSVNTSSGRPVASIRKTMDGEVVLQGTLQRAGPPAAGTNILTWPLGMAPTGRQTYGFATDTGLGAAEATTTNYVYFSGGTATYPLDEVRFTAADRTPTRWTAPVDVRLGTPAQPFPGKPGFVSVLRVRRKDGLQVPTAAYTLPDWEPVNLEKLKSAPGVRLHRVYGLTPGVQYTVTLLILPE